MPRPRPDAALFKPHHRPSFTQTLMVRIGIVQERMRERIDERRGTLDDRIHVSLLSARSAPCPASGCCITACRLNPYLAAFAGDCHPNPSAINSDGHAVKT